MIYKYVISFFILNCFLLSVNGRCSGIDYVECDNMTRQALINELRNHSEYSLYSLVIRNSNLYKINKELISSVPSAHYLTFDNCGITTIEKKSLQKMSDYLLKLILTGNNLTQFDTEVFSQSSNIDYLNVSNNNIKELKINCLFHQRLRILILDNNPLETLTNDNFTSCSQLKTLKMRNCKIKQIRIEFQRLTYLDISDNNLSKLEKYVFANLSSLKALNLSNNEMTEITCKLFPKNNILEDLDFSFNNLNGIRICAFEKLHKLLNLYLQNNNLQILRIGTFSGVANLKYLDLSHNELTSVDETVLHPLEMIETINISANKFVALDPVALLQHLLRLKQIDLSGNDWDCFNLTLVGKYLRQRGITYTAKIQNYSQENIGGIQCSSNNNNDQHVTTSQNEITVDRNVNANNEALFKAIANQNNYFQRILNKIEINNEISKNLTDIIRNVNVTNEALFQILASQKNLTDIVRNVINNEMEKISNEKSQLNENYPQKQLSETEIKNNEFRKLHNILIIFVTLCVCYVLGKLIYKYYTTKNSKNKLKKTSNTSQCEIELINEFKDPEQSTTNN